MAGGLRTCLSAGRDPGSVPAPEVHEPRAQKAQPPLAEIPGFSIKNLDERRSAFARSFDRVPRRMTGRLCSCLPAGR